MPQIGGEMERIYLGVGSDGMLAQRLCSMRTSVSLEDGTVSLGAQGSFSTHDAQK